MTTIDPVPTTRGSGGVRRDRNVVLLVAAAALVVVVVGAVLLFGVDRPPPVAPLEDAPSPAPTAAIAWTHDSGERTCARVGWPDGRITEPRCERGGGELTGWEEEHLVMRRWDDDQARLVDPETGEIVGRTPDAWARTGDEDAVWTEYRDGELVVRMEGDDTELWRVPAAERYEIRSSTRSPDGGWVALVDVAGRLLVVPSDGSAAPRQWASGLSGWQRPHWQGAG